MASLRLLQDILPLGDLGDDSLKTEPSINGIEGLYSLPGNSIQEIRARATKGLYQVEDNNSQQLSRIIDGLENHKRDIDTYIHRLQPIRNVIESFQTDLDKLLTLLVSSREKSAKLSLDKVLQNHLVSKLTPVVLDLMIPPRIIKSICEDEVDEKWCENLEVLSEKVALIESNKYAELALVANLKVLVDKLTAKCIERIRDNIILKIKQLRLPANTNVSLQQIQHLLLALKEAYLFLVQHHKELSVQLRLAYFYTMKWYYESHFAKYIYALEKLKVRHVDVIFEDNWKWLSSFGSSSGVGGGNLGVGGPGSGANLGLLDPSSAAIGNVEKDQGIRINEYLQLVEKRNKIFDNPVQVIPLQIAETTPFAYWQEFVFQQWIYALVDNIIVEYLFVVEYWYQGQEMFPMEVDNKNWRTVIFETVFQYSSGFVNYLISNGSLNPVSGRTKGGDSFALLMCIRMVQNLQAKLHEVHIPIIDEHLTHLLMDIWPHFTRIIDVNCEAMKRAIIHTKSGTISLAPLAVSQQLAQLIAGLLKVAPADAKTTCEPLFTSIRRLCNDFEVALTKLSNSAFKSKGTEKELFLFNNYFLVATILRNEESGEFFKDQIDHFQMLCDTYQKK